MIALRVPSCAYRCATAVCAVVFAATLTSTCFAAEAAPEVSSENYFLWVVRSSGLIGALILLLSMYFVATVVRLFIELREEVAIPPNLVQQLDQLVQQRELRTAYQLIKDDPSFVAKILSVGASELPNGLSEARETLDRASEAQTIELEKKISMLAVLGTLGPMIGLLGTLKGMISSFSVIALAGVQLDASEVAGGISEALLLTFEGVALSVPAIYFFALFRNRISTISANATLRADRLLRKMYQAAKAKPTMQPAPVVAGPPVMN